jgi:hypothetical protein
MHEMRTYHLVSLRVNLTKEEVSKLSAEMTQQMFQEMHLEEIRQAYTISRKSADTVPYIQILKEVKIAFPFIDTMSNGWIMLPNAKQAIDTIPMVVYKTFRPINKTQTNQLYNFLRTRLAKDTVVLVRKQF